MRLICLDWLYTVIEKIIRTTWLQLFLISFAEMTVSFQSSLQSLEKFSLLSLLSLVSWPIPKRPNICSCILWYVWYFYIILLFILYLYYSFVLIVCKVSIHSWWWKEWAVSPSQPVTVLTAKISRKGLMQVKFFNIGIINATMLCWTFNHIRWCLQNIVCQI